MKPKTDRKEYMRLYEIARKEKQKEYYRGYVRPSLRDDVQIMACNPNARLARRFYSILDSVLKQ